MNAPNCEMKQMVDNEERDDWSAPVHRPRRVRGADRLAFVVTDRARGPLEIRKLDRCNDVQRYGYQKGDSCAPQKCRKAVQMLGVRIECLPAQKELQVAGHVPDKKAEQYQTGNGHDDLLSDCGPVKEHTT